MAKTTQQSPTVQTELDSHYMALCLGLARQAESQDEVPIGALIVDSNTGEILAKAYNLREKLQSALGHAEVLALHRASRKRGAWRLLGTTLYTTLEPCVMCAGALVQARVERVVYGAQDSKGGGHSLFQLLKSPQLNHRLEITAGVCEKECREILQNYFQKKRHSKP